MRSEKNRQRLTEMLAPKKKRGFDFTPFIGLAFGMMACGILFIWGLGLAKDLVESMPTPSDEIPYADRVDEDVPSGPLTYGAEVAIDPLAVATVATAEPTPPVAFHPTFHAYGGPKFYHHSQRITEYEGGSSAGFIGEVPFQ